MRILLDECMPAKITPHLLGHQVSTLKREGWRGLKNGKLLVVAQDRFSVF